MKRKRKKGLQKKKKESEARNAKIDCEPNENVVQTLNHISEFQQNFNLFPS